MSRFLIFALLSAALGGCALPPNAADGSNPSNPTQAAYGSQAQDPYGWGTGVGIGVGIGSWGGRGGAGVGIGYGW